MASTEQHPDPARRWKNRRRMAWASLFASLAYPLLLITVEDGQALASIAGPFYVYRSCCQCLYRGSYMGGQ